MKRFFPSPVSSISLIALIIIILACAGGDWGEQEAKTAFFSQSVMIEDQKDEALQPFFRIVTEPFYGNQTEDYSNIHLFNDINISEWKDYLGKEINEQEINQLLYSSTLEEIDHLIFYIKDNKYAKIPAALKAYSITKMVDKTKAKNFLYYLGFAKRCEYVSAKEYDYWDYQEGNLDEHLSDIKFYEDQISGGNKLLKNVRDKFLKERYYFQLCRLYYQKALHIDQDFASCVEMYYNVRDSFSVSKSMEYRTMGYAAAALYKQKAYARANYLYALIYDNYPEMSTIAQYSFHPQEEADFKQALSYAKNNREKEALWHLLGIYGDEFRAIKAIYALNPKSDLLSLLLVRYVSTLEEETLAARENAQNDYSYIPDVYINGGVDMEALNTIQAIADKGNTLKPYLWDLSCAYMYILRSESAQAVNYFQKAKNNASGNQLVQEQIRLLSLIGSINERTAFTTKEEDKLLADMDWLYNEDKHKDLIVDDAQYFVRRKLSSLFLQQGEEEKAMCMVNYSIPGYYYDIAKMDKMIAYLQRPNLSKFERLMVGMYEYSKDDLLEAEAVRYTYDGKIEAAIAKMKLSENGQFGLQGDPFEAHVYDCHDCDHQQHGFKYTKLEFLEEMKVRLNNIAKKPDYNTYMELGNAWYNISYFGNARYFYDNGITGTDTYGTFFFPLKDEYWNQTNGYNDFIFDCSKAEKYYNLAASITNDPEKKAECTFMAAKCEQNNYFTHKEPKDNRDFKAGVYFKKLKTDFRNTQYYKEAIAQCGYFETYVKRGR
ncbi:MAG: hypothetical protein K1X55_16790 [Chitinophagales bacterium]|nr:hypothetical protein [Chitinophagales bacterium]